MRILGRGKFQSVVVPETERKLDTEQAGCISLAIIIMKYGLI